MSYEIDIISEQLRSESRANVRTLTGNLIRGLVLLGVGLALVSNETPESMRSYTEAASLFPVAAAVYLNKISQIRPQTTSTQNDYTRSTIR